MADLGPILALLSAALSLVPIAALLGAYRGTRSPRLLLAVFAFAAFAIREVIVGILALR